MSDSTVMGHDLENVYNLNEGAVVEAIERIIAADDSICKCKMCLEDVFALALNTLPAKYVQSYYSTHDVNKLVDSKQIDKVVSETVKKVAKNPHHD
jgi:competence protein ComFB